MGSIAEKLDYLSKTKEEIRIAMNAAGASITEKDGFRSYAGKLLNALPPDETGTWVPAIAGYEGHSAVWSVGQWTRKGNLVHVQGRIQTRVRLDPEESTLDNIAFMITGFPFKLAAGDPITLNLSNWNLPLDYSKKYNIIKNGIGIAQYLSPPEFEVYMAAGADRCFIRANAKGNNDIIAKLPLSLSAVTSAIPLLTLDLEYPIAVE